MRIRDDDYDPTDQGLPSEADYAAVVEMRTRRLLPALRRARQPRRTAEAPSRSIGPSTPPAGGGSERVRDHMDTIYAQMGWVKADPEEIRARRLREARREQQRR